MATKTTTLAPPSLSTVLQSNTIQSAPVSNTNTASPSWSSTATKESNAAKLAAIRAANKAKQSAMWAVDSAIWGIISDVWALESWNDNAALSPYLSSMSWVSTIGQLKSWIQSGAITSPSINPIKTPKTTAPKTTNSNVETINWVKKTYVPRVNTKAFTESLGKARSRAEYNSGINYDELDEQSKKIADRYYTAAEKAGKLLPPKDMYEERMDVETEEAKKTRETLEKQKEEMTAAEKKSLDETILNDIDPAISQTESERDAFIAEQEKLAADTEANRLNQVRGNIMQVLAARGVDISKLAPEQIVALSGEQGAKAFMDITDIREKTKSNIKQARDNALARLNDLRQRKAISKSAYERNVANINSQAETAQLNADKNASAQIFALTQTKTEQGRTDATQRANAVTNMASMLGLSGSQIAPVLNLINTKGTGPEQLVEIARMIANPESPLRKSLDANMSAAQQAAMQQALLDEYKAETARISATRARSSGGKSSTWTQTVQI